MLGGLVLVSLLTAATVGLIVKLLDRRSPPSMSAIEDDPRESASVSTSVADPTAIETNPHRFCCVPRDQINPVQIQGMERQLAERWPELRSLGRERVTMGDRLAFVVEAGRVASSRARELLTGTALAEHDGMLIVGLGCEPQLSRQHGLCCESLTLIPRETIVAWSKAGTPERAVELGRPTPLSLARFVREGEPIRLVVHTVPGMQWATEPADVATVHVLELDDGLATIALRDARPGRLDLVATAEHESWGELSWGRWPIVVVT